jgi:hypothetical protein
LIRAITALCVALLLGACDLEPNHQWTLIWLSWDEKHPDHAFTPHFEHGFVTEAGCKEASMYLSASMGQNFAKCFK